jgi:hypothetical protein
MIRISTFKFVHKAKESFNPSVHGSCFEKVAVKPVLRIRDDYPEYEFFKPGFRVKNIPNPGYGSASASKNLSIFNPKNCF